MPTRRKRTETTEGSCRDERDDVASWGTRTGGRARTGNGRKAAVRALRAQRAGTGDTAGTGSGQRRQSGNRERAEAAEWAQVAERAQKARRGGRATRVHTRHTGTNHRGTRVHAKGCTHKGTHREHARPHTDIKHAQVSTGVCTYVRTQRHQARTGGSLCHSLTHARRHRRAAG